MVVMMRKAVANEPPLIIFQDTCAKRHWKLALAGFCLSGKSLAKRNSWHAVLRLQAPMKTGHGLLLSEVRYSLERHARQAHKAQLGAHGINQLSCTVYGHKADMRCLTDIIKQPLDCTQGGLHRQKAS